MTEQSPIDIPASAPVERTGLEFRYGPAVTTIVDDGYTLRADRNGSDRLTVDGHPYRLLQFHLHSPAEHTFSGHAGAMELHLVHADEAGSLAVVAVVLESGAHHPSLDALLAGGEPTIDPAELLPADRAYVGYRGSLTTPPYTEGVTWRVLVRPIELSSGQLAAFRRIHHGNARPLQPLGDRQLVRRA